MPLFIILLIILLSFFGLLLFDYNKTRDLARSNEVEKRVHELENQIENYRERIEHLEEIVIQEDFNSQTINEKPKSRI